VARRCCFARKRDVAFEHLVGIATDLHAWPTAIEYLDPMRRPRPVALLLLMLMMATAVVAAAITLALALSHRALVVLVGHHPPLGWNATPWTWPHWALFRSRANSRRFLVKMKSFWRPRRWEPPAPPSWFKVIRNRLTFQQLFARAGPVALY